jgi:hypothetical protein
MVRRSDVVLQAIQSISQNTSDNPRGRKADLSKALRIGNMPEAARGVKEALTRPQPGSALSDLLAPSPLVSSVLDRAVPIGDRNKESDVYVATVKKGKLVLKKPKTHARTMCLAREYVLGEMALNRLRGLVPTFVYTLGAFVSPTSGALFLACEHIPGSTMREALAKSEVTFREWLGVYCQILLSLELAQRECNFTHFDLHGDNVILKPVQTSYEVPIGAHTYHVSRTTLVPVIIDFGYATASVNGARLGSKEHKKHGMLETMVAGTDQYKLLSACATAAQDEQTRLDITGLFSFYQDNPYTQDDKPDPRTANRTFCARVTSSSASSVTPLDMLDWILQTHNVPHITKGNREIYAPIQPVTVTPAQWAEVLETAAMRSSSSDPVDLLIAKHDLHIARALNQKKDPEVDAQIELVDISGSIPDPFRSVYTIKVPWDAIRGIPDVYEPGSGVSDVDALQAYMDKMRTPMCLLYIARETGELAEERRQLETTEQYQTYCVHYNDITRALRWAMTRTER